LSLLLPSSHVSPELTVLLPQSGGCVVVLVDVVVLMLVVEDDVVDGPAIVEVVVEMVGMLDVLLLVLVLLDVEDVEVADAPVVLELDEVVVVVGAAVDEVVAAGLQAAGSASMPGTEARLAQSTSWSATQSTQSTMPDIATIALPQLEDGISVSTCGQLETNPTEDRLTSPAASHA